MPSLYESISFKLSIAAALSALTLFSSAAMDVCWARASDSAKNDHATAAAPAVTKNSNRRHFVFTYQVSVVAPENASNGATTPKPDTNIEMWLPLPSDGGGQAISNLKITTTAEHSIASDPEFGNRVLHLSAKPSAARGQRAELSATIQVEVERSLYTGERAGPHAEDAPARYLLANRLVPVDGLIKDLADQAIASLPDSANREDPMAKARAIYDYVTRTINYDKSGTGWGRGDALFACDAKSGNCTDFHALFIAMSRAAGLPARFEIGFPLDPLKTSGRVAGYHCWAEFFIKGKGWIPVDASEAQKRPQLHEYYFGNLDPNRVRFSTGRDIIVKQPGRGADSPRLNYFVYPYVEFNGRPLADNKLMKLDFSYRDIESSKAQGANHKEPEAG